MKFRRHMDEPYLREGGAMTIDSAKVKELAREVGFDLCGITNVEQLAEAPPRLKTWLDSGYHGEMAYLTREPERRADPSLVVPGARSVIVLGVNYYQEDTAETSPGCGKVSRYARGRDYHDVIERMAGTLIEKMRVRLEPQTTAIFKPMVDYGPILERGFAQRAGLGYVGRNCMLINRTFGSWIFLSEILTNLELEPDDSRAINHGECRDCRRCLEACPTGALLEGRVVDATKCISYFTVERGKGISREIADSMGNRIFGCDICQEVCPHNKRRSTVTRHEELRSENGVGEFLDAGRVLALDSEEAFAQLTGGTSLARARLEGLRRNAQIVLDNEAAGRRIRARHGKGVRRSKSE